MTASQFTVVFMALIALNVALRLWLDTRQMRHVKAHRDNVPPQFAGRIPVAAHQKAADYTVARTRLSIVEDMVGTFDFSRDARALFRAPARTVFLIKASYWFGV